MEKHEASESFIDWPKIHPSKELSIFPPTNHENLHIYHQSQSSSASQCSSSSSSSLSSLPFDDIEYDPESFSPSDETETTGDDDGDHLQSSISRSGSGGDARNVLLSLNYFSRWLSVGNEVLCARVFRIVSWLKNCDAVRGRVLSFGSLAGVAVALIVSALYRSRRRMREGRFNQLMILLNQRDERILLLLQQIAKMNESLVARQRYRKPDSG